MTAGSCGYFDESGFWSKLFDLNDPQSLSDHGLGNAQDTHEQLRESDIVWEPKLSDGVSKVDVKFSTAAL